MSPGSVDASEAPYFVDLVHDQLMQKLGDRDFNREGLRIYTSLDPDLQRVATTAVERTMHLVDEQVDRKHARDQKAGKPYIYPQVALIALNPHTGQVLALVGGPQLRRIAAGSRGGAAAHGLDLQAVCLCVGVSTRRSRERMLPGQDKLFSPVTMLNDQQTTYERGTQ